MNKRSCIIRVKHGKNDFNKTGILNLPKDHGHIFEDNLIF